MSTGSHDAIVNGQFGPQARSYLTSPVHSSGEDLDRMSELAAACGKDATALDVGCGGGHASYRLAPLVAKVVAYDLSEAMLAVVAEEARGRGLANVAVVQGAAESLPFPDASFDLAVTRYSAHHWADVRRGLAEMRRVVRPDGRGIFMDAIAPVSPLLDTWFQSLELLRDPSHVRDYSLQEWQSMLVDAGFRVVQSMHFRIRLDFAAWIARMRTPASHVEAIRSLQRRADAGVTEYFGFEEDGSFAIETALVVAEAGQK